MKQEDSNGKQSSAKQKLKNIGKSFRHIYSGPWYKKLFSYVVTFIIAIILLLIAVDNNFLYLFGKSPGFHEIENPVTNEASEIYLSLIHISEPTRPY